MSHLWHRPKTSDGNMLSPVHKVSFSDSSKSSHKRDSGRPSTASNSRPSSPHPRAPQQRSSSSRASSHIWGDNRNLQRINRQSEALWQYVVLRGHRHRLTSQDPLSYPQPPHNQNPFSSITTPSFPYSGPIRLFSS